jgi:uncharacterized membrane protein YciS (DUF1049 family)
MGGVGFRYLLARKFKLRVGIDVAHSTGTWAYYIIFGLYYFCQQLAKVNYSRIRTLKNFCYSISPDRPRNF